MTSTQPKTEEIEVPIDFAGKEEVERLEHEVITDSRGCPHHFVRKSEHTAECSHQNCRMGVFINETDRIVDGKIELVA